MISAALVLPAWGYTTVDALWLVVGDGEPNNFGDTRGAGIVGPLAGLVIALLAIGTVLLIRSMNKRLRRLPPSFDVDTQAGRDPLRHGGVAPISPAGPTSND